MMQQESFPHESFPRESFPQSKDQGSAPQQQQQQQQVPVSFQPQQQPSEAPVRKGKSTIKVRRLTAAEERLKNAIVQACHGSFDHLNLPSAGVTSLNTFQSLISEGAEDAVLIKRHVERTRNNDKPIHFNTGGACEYLKTLETFPSDTETLVRELVHSVFRNSSGYVVPTTMDDIDNRLDALFEIKSTEEVKERKELDVIEKALKDSWTRVNNRAKEVFALIEESTYPGPEYVPLLTKAFSGVHDLEDLFDQFHQTLLTLAWEQRTSEYAPPEAVKDEKDQRYKPEEYEFEDDLGFDLPMENFEMPEGAEGAEGFESADFQQQQQQQQGQPEGQQKEVDKSEKVIRRVSTDVGILQERVMALTSDIEQLDVQEVANTPESKEILVNLQLRCSSFLENLTNDLEALDELSVGREARLRKKEQIQRIQNLVTTIDNLLPKVHDLADNLRGDLPPREGGQGEDKGKMRESPEGLALAGSSLETDAQRAVHQEMIEEQRILNDLVEFENLLGQKIQEEIELQRTFEQEVKNQFERLRPQWKEVSLNPKMLIDETLSDYQITAYLPNMLMNDVNISTSKEGLAPILTIRGFRGPSPLDIALMRRQLVRSGVVPEDPGILRLGTGRFGTFVEKFAVPLDVDMAEIDAEYDSGELSVIMPKVRLVRAPIDTEQREILW